MIAGIKNLKPLADLLTVQRILMENICTMKNHNIVPYLKYMHKQNREEPNIQNTYNDETNVNKKKRRRKTVKLNKEKARKVPNA